MEAEGICSLFSQETRLTETISSSFYPHKNEKNRGMEKSAKPYKVYLEVTHLIQANGDLVFPQMKRKSIN